jgi:hypothetical protein
MGQGEDTRGEGSPGVRADRRRRREGRRPFPPSGVVFPWEEEWARKRMALALEMRESYVATMTIPWAKLPQAYREGIRDGWLSDCNDPVAVSKCYTSHDYSSGWHEGRLMQRDRVMARAGERGEL